MPLREFSCQTCKNRFEEILSGAEVPVCPRCGGKNLKQLLSRFAVSSRSGAPPSRGEAGACGSCGDPRGPGACALDD